MRIIYDSIQTMTFAAQTPYLIQSYSDERVGAGGSFYHIPVSHIRNMFNRGVQEEEGMTFALTTRQKWALAIRIILRKIVHLF